MCVANNIMQLYSICKWRCTGLFTCTKNSWNEKHTAVIKQISQSMLYFPLAVTLLVLKPSWSSASWLLCSVYRDLPLQYIPVWSQVLTKAFLIPNWGEPEQAPHKRDLIVLMCVFVYLWLLLLNKCILKIFHENWTPTCKSEGYCHTAALVWKRLLKQVSCDCVSEITERLKHQQRRSTQYVRLGLFTVT